MSYLKRKALVAVTLTAEEWDAVRGDEYVYPKRSTALALIGRATGSSERRRDDAYVEAQASLPPLTRVVEECLRILVRELIRLRENNEKIGDHLGCGNGWPKGLDGWRVTCIYRTDPSTGGWPNMSFQRTPVWFERKEVPMTDAEKRTIVNLVEDEREVVNVWGGGSWLSVRWRMKP